MDSLNLQESMENKLVKAINNSSSYYKNDEILSELNNREIFIFGIGNAGTMTYNLLKSMNFDVKGFFDKRFETVNSHLGKKVYGVDNTINKENILIIISFICSIEELKNIKSDLFKLGYINVYYFHEISILSMKLDDIQKNKDESLNSNCMFKNREKSILEIESYLSDDRSRTIYYDFYNAITNSNLDLFSTPDSDEQYFPKDIEFSKGYERFVDCGAYDGDTARTLKKLKGKVEKIVLFEPDLNNFKKLCDTIESDQIALDEILYPCGVWSKTEVLTFKAGFECSSSISVDGEISVQCIALDDVLRSFQPTFIKMDIEGAEYEALLGAQFLIETYKPDLAISVYHKLDDIITIPILLKKMNPNYEFYLRTYAYFGMETILYAVDNSKESRNEA